MRFVLDASVAIKLYAPEPDSDAALSAVEANAPFLVPDIFSVEVAQALLRHHREGRLSLSELNDAVQEVLRFVGEYRPSAHLLERSMSIAQSLHHRLHDCVYLALAERSGLPLLTADERLIRKVRGRLLPIVVVSLAETC